MRLIRYFFKVIEIIVPAAYRPPGQFQVQDMARIKETLSLPWKAIQIPLTSIRKWLDNLIVEQGTKEFKLEAQQAVTAMILSSAGRWIYFILVMITAHAMAMALESSPALFVAFGITAGVYGYYALMLLKIGHFCHNVWQRNGFIWNPIHLIYLYIYDMVVSEIKENRFTRYANYLFFPFRREQHAHALARDIIAQGLMDDNLWICVGARILLFAAGWGIYLLCYKQVFIYAAGIELDNWYEPLIWPVTTVCDFLAEKFLQL